MPTLHWIGKEKVVNHHRDVPFRVLEHEYRFTTGKKTEAESSGNKIIHGDNLEALKSLLPEYEGKIKCIYIDPPYNTGNEGWVYNDNVNHPKIKKWLGDVVGKEGDDLSRHDKWLCMMYPRLQLLNRLLADDGVIFISIDDNEQANLKLVCDEIFGRKNFITTFTWRTDGNFDNQAKIKVNHEYILCIAKRVDFFSHPEIIDPNIGTSSKLFKKEIRNTVVKNGFKNPIGEIVLNPGFPADFEEGEIEARNDQWPHYSEKAVVANWELTNEVTIKSGWSSKALLENFNTNGFNKILDNKGQETTFKIIPSGAIEIIKKRGMPSHVISSLQNLGSTQNMSNELKGMDIAFSYPKPNSLLEYLLQIVNTKNSIILDSFAGSGTTAHAVLNLNKQDGGNRKFILVEMEDYADSITAERVKRVMQGYGEGNKAVEGTGGSFDYYTLGKPLFTGENQEYLNEEVALEKIRQYIWYSETRSTFQSPAKGEDNEYLLGTKDRTAYYFVYDKGSLTTLDYDLLSTIKTKAEQYIIYADNCLLPKEFMSRKNIIFKKIPRDISRF